MLLTETGINLLAVWTFDPLYEDHGLALALMGIFVVFSALALVVMFITLLPRFVAVISPKEQPLAIETPSLDPDELPEELVVVLAAAVAATLGQPRRIVKVRGLLTDDQAWSIEGRMQHHHSHRMSNPRRT